jgi:predicted PurR-regulated permease PerM
MDEEKIPQKDSTPQSDSQPEPQAKTEPTPTRPAARMPISKDGGWAGAPTSQVVRTIAAALLTVVVVLVGLLLLWQVRTFVGWLVISVFLAAVLNPAVNWLQRRQRLIKRPLAIALTYLGVVVVLLFVVGIFLPLLVDQINGLTKFITTAAQAPEGPTQYIKGLLQQNGLGALAEVRRPTLRSEDAAG